MTAGKDLAIVVACLLGMASSITLIENNISRERGYQKELMAEVTRKEITFQEGLKQFDNYRLRCKAYAFEAGAASLIFLGVGLSTLYSGNRRGMP